MFCNACGTQNLDSSVFCTKCGTNLETGVKPSADQIAPGQPGQLTPQSRSMNHPRYDYYRDRSYGATGGSILGWVLLIVALAGVAGCFFPLRGDGAGSSIIDALKDEKFAILFPAGFGLAALGSLFLGLGVGAQKTWMTIVGLGTGMAVGGALFLLSANMMRFDGFSYGFHLLFFSAAVAFVVALVEGFWPS